MFTRYAAAAALFLSNTAVWAEVDHSAWTELLQSHVEIDAQGSVSTVDYRGFETDRAALDSYLDVLASVETREFDSWSIADQLAFLINAYNAWTVELILTGYPELNSIRELGTVTESPWQRRFIPLLGEERTLDEIEHGMIRESGRYNDPRIHFAVNCASIGCPALRDEAFTGARLEDQLEAGTTGFLSDTARNRMEDGGLAVSSIFSWYRGDFEQGWRGTETLGAFLARYSDSLGLTAEQAGALRSGAMDIRFLEYDWRLNDTDVPPADAGTGYVSPIWLIRSFPEYAAMAGAMLIIVLGGGIYLIRRHRKRRTT